MPFKIPSSRSKEAAIFICHQDFTPHIIKRATKKGFELMNSSTDYKDREYKSFEVSFIFLSFTVPENRRGGTHPKIWQLSVKFHDRLC
jgi:hypothetical protein